MTSRKSEKKAYSGLLAKPMPKFTALTRPADSEIDALLDAKMRALFDHYAIDPTDAFTASPKMAVAWANLAWHLARAHVPGFAGAPRGRGKPATRKQDDVDLVMHVALLKRRDDLSDRKAIGCIVKDRLVVGTNDSLLKRYKEAKKLFAPMFKILDNLEATTGKAAVVETLRSSLFGDEKETILSPDESCD